VTRPAQAHTTHQDRGGGRGPPPTGREEAAREEEAGEDEEEEQDIHMDVNVELQRQRARRGRATAPGARVRASEGDIAITGPSFSRMVLIDVHIVSPLAPHRIKDWNEQPRFRGATTIEKIIEDAETFKRRHYMSFPEKLQGKSKESIDPKDPLASMEIELVPAVLTPLGNIAPALDGLLQRLARQRVTMENEDAAAAGTDQASVMYDKMRVRAVHSRYRKIVAVAMARATAASFSNRPKQANVV
jgi:hypothetical protein